MEWGIFAYVMLIYGLRFLSIAVQAGLIKDPSGISTTFGPQEGRFRAPGDRTGIGAFDQLTSAELRRAIQSIENRDIRRRFVEESVDWKKVGF